MIRLAPEGVYRCSRLDALDWLDHGFGTRQHPAPAPLDHLVTVRQVHGDRWLEARGLEPLGEADAIVCQTPGVWIAVKTADCLPILVVDPVHRAIAAVHAGWRGTRSRIVARVLEGMQRLYGTEPADCLAAIGPGIASCCFEVGPEVAREFAGVWPELAGSETQVMLDLMDANSRFLEASGVPADRVTRFGGCTKCTGEEFYSFRREKGLAGRMYSGVRLKRLAEGA